MKLRYSVFLVALACFAWGCSNRTPLTLGDGGLEPVEEPCDVLAELRGLSGSFDAAVRVTSPVAKFCESEANSKFAGLYEIVAYEAPSAGELVVSGDAPVLLSRTCGIPTDCDRERWVPGPLGLSGHSARMRLGMGQRVFVYVQSGRYTYRLNAVDRLEDCDGDPTNGYEADTARDASHCGACGVSCPEGASGRWQTGCSNGVCCTEGRADCDGDAANRCEVDLASSAMHCGGCGVACDVATGCLDGACCPTGFSNCDGSNANACETNLLTEATNCGACGRVCRPGEACAEGTCACQPGLADCDADATNGCETDTAQSDDHCGGCGVACAADEFCAEGVCGPRVCAPDETRCANATTLERCDARGTGFAATPCGDRVTCSEGACRAWVCTPGEQRCVDGTLSARETCDADGLRWVPSPACEARNTCTGAGACTPWVCTPNEGSCGRGASTRVCNPDGLGYSPIMDCGASESCDPITGMCDGWVCAPGVTTCVDETNTQRICRADGLEFVDAACGPGTTCQAGECVPWLCTPGTFSCVDVNTRQVCNEDGLGYSAATCTGPAANGYACVDAGTCVERLCVPGTASDTCASATARSVCSATGLNFAAQPCNVGEVCAVDGQCQCAEGQRDCNMFSADGCEATLSSAVANCGACGVDCRDDNPCTIDSCVDGVCAAPSNVAAGTVCPAGVCDGVGACVACVDDAGGGGVDSGCNAATPVCADSGTPFPFCRAVPVWRFLTTNTRNVVRGLCSGNVTSDVVCDLSQLGRELRIRSRAVSGYEIPATSVARAALPASSIDWEQGGSYTVASPSVMRVTGRSSCSGGVAIQAAVLDVFVCQ